MSETLTGSSFAPVINFTEIPPAGQLLVPGVYIEIKADYTNVGLLPFPARALIIGQMFTTGTGAGTGTANQVYQIRQADQAPAIFGAGSPLAEAIACFLRAKPGIPLDAIGITGASAPGAARASGKFTFGGSPTRNGLVAVSIAGYRVAFGVMAGDAPADMAAGLVAALPGIYNAQNVPATLATSSTPGEVVVTPAYTGAAGNEIDLRKNPAEGDQLPPGVTLTVTQMSGGVGVPDISAALSAIASTWYTDIGLTFNDSTTLGLVKAAAESRYTAMANVDSHFFFAFDGSQGQIASEMDGINSPFISLIGTTNAPDPSWRWAASLMGVAAKSAVADPALQLRGLALPGIIAPRAADRLFEPEQNALLAEGVSTWDTAPDGTVILQRVVTTYTESDLGVPDAAWRDIMVPKVLTRIRWDWRNYLLLVYPNFKLADEGSLAAEYGQNVATPRTIQAAWAARCKLYARAGWIENEDETIKQSVFARDPSDRNRLNSQRRIQIIGNLMIDAEQLVFAA